MYIIPTINHFDDPELEKQSNAKFVCSMRPPDSVIYRILLP